MELQLLGDDVENGGLPRAVAAVQEGNGGEVQPRQVLEGEDLEGVGVVHIVAGHIQLVGLAAVQYVVRLVALGGQAEGFQIDHGRLLSVGSFLHSLYHTEALLSTN